MLNNYHQGSIYSIDWLNGIIATGSNDKTIALLKLATENSV